LDKDYNIDDILSELKEHREEEKPLEPPQPPISAESADPEPVDEAQIKDNNPEPPQDVSQDTAPDALPEPQRDERQQQNEEVASINIIDVSEDDSGEVEITDGEEEDSDDDPPKPYVSKGSKRRKIAIAVLSVLLALVIAAGATTYLVANNMLNNLIKNNANPVATTEKPWTGMDKLEENFEPIEEKEATELASLQDMIKDWYYNGTPCSSTHVLNVLLIGEDTRGKKFLKRERVPTRQ